MLGYLGEGMPCHFGRTFWPPGRRCQKARLVKIWATLLGDRGGDEGDIWQVEVLRLRCIFCCWLLANRISTRWWFQIFLIFTPILGKIAILTNILQMG